jgi:H+/Cl- antiporter ClcA
MKILVFSLFFIILGTVNVSAQCAMCRSTLENNFSNGDPGIAAGMNTGILYLLILPYLAIAVLGILWYKTTKNAGKEFDKRVA